MWAAIEQVFWPEAGIWQGQSRANLRQGADKGNCELTCSWLLLKSCVETSPPAHQSDLSRAASRSRWTMISAYLDMIELRAIGRTQKCKNCLKKGRERNFRQNMNLKPTYDTSTGRSNLSFSVFYNYLFFGDYCHSLFFLYKSYFFFHISDPFVLA